MRPLDQCWPIAQAAGMATILEASAPKLGNVHPAASFQDMQFGDFVASAAAVAGVFEEVDHLTIGQLILAAVTATRQRTGCNTNLGTILLLAPLAKAASGLVAVPTEQSRFPGMVSNGLCRSQLQVAVAAQLQSLSAADSHLVYQAIRVAQPGGLGQQLENDVAGAAPAGLLDAMRQVASVDAVARQYVNDFADVFDQLLPWLDVALVRYSSPLKAIVHVQLQIMAWQPDGLIIRKCGWDVARRVQRQAQQVLDVFESDKEQAQYHLDDLDGFLRSDGNRLNPGTTADLIAATLFCRLLSPT